MNQIKMFTFKTKGYEIKIHLILMTQQYILHLKFHYKKNITKVNALNDKRCDIKTYDQHHLLVIEKISLIGNKVLSFINSKLDVIKQVHNEFMGGLNVIMIGDYIRFPLSKIHGFSNQQLIFLIL
jgi:hypothetical protein